MKKRMMILAMLMLSLGSTACWEAGNLGNADEHAAEEAKAVSEVSEEEMQTVWIKSETDLQKLADNCRLDSWSAGVHVVLTQDIDLTGRAFDAIPYFAGIFDGRGHTIKGLRTPGSGSHLGLFRYVAEGGVIRNLHVEGSICPVGSAEYVGGIAGENGGSILNCSFTGSITAKNTVGGITGINHESGLISGCSFHGTILGEHEIGGIAGRNDGEIAACSNEAYVNIEIPKVESALSTSLSGGISGNLSDFDISSVGAEDFIDIMDIGGIAGHSEGEISACVNTGEVGYKHIGYNVGGIAGRSGGYIVNCNNEGKILGRKDVGGICGQIEPETIWEFSQSKISQLKVQLEGLGELIDTLFYDLGDNAGSIRDQLDTVAGNAGNTIGELEILTNDVSADARSLGEYISYFMTQLDDAVREENAAKIGSTLQSLAAFLQAADLSRQSIGFRLTADAQLDLDAVLKAQGDMFFEKLKEYYLQFSGKNVPAAGDFSNAGGSYSYADNNDNAGGTEDDPGDTEGGLDLEGLIEPENGSASDYVPDPLDEQLIDLGNEDEDISQLMAYHREQGDFSPQFVLLGTESVDLLNSEDGDGTDRTNGIYGAGSNVSGYFDGKLMFSPAMSPDMSVDLEQLRGIITDLLTDSPQLINQDALNNVKDVLKNVQIDPPDTMAFYKAFSELAESITPLADEAVSMTGTAALDIDAITDQMNGIYETFFDLLENDSVLDKQAREDAADMDPYQSDEASVQKCLNAGVIYGDTNVGGVVGTIGYESEFDAEGLLDVTNYLLKDAKYRIFSSVRVCRNTAQVSAKKEDAGGIVGTADFGIITESTNTGEILTEGGNCCGGIVGKTDGVVTRCVAGGKVSGAAYVGGITGSGSIITNCVAYSKIENGTEYVGAIAGTVQGEVSGCQYVDRGWGGIDNIGYETKAVPVKLPDETDVGEAAKQLDEMTVTLKEETENNKPDEEETIRSTIGVEGKHPAYLAEGCFRPHQTLTVTEYDAELQTLPKEETKNNPWLEKIKEKIRGIFFESYIADAKTVSVNDSQEPLIMHVHVPSGGRLYTGTDKVLAQTAYRKDGSYIVFSMANGDSFVYTLERERESAGKYKIAALAAGVILIGGALLLKRKKSK